MTHKPTKELRRSVEALAGYGVQQREIATIVGVTINTVRKHYKKELEVGLAKVHGKIGEAIVKGALNGDKTLLIFYAKTQMGWKEPIHATIDTGDGLGELLKYVADKGTRIHDK